MIIADRFVFLHLHKSGGSFVNECLLRHVPDARQIGYHLPRAMIPSSHADLPVIGFTRSPWSYYVSWYAFQKRNRTPNPLFRVLSRGGVLEFDATIRNMLSLGDSAGLIDEVIAALPTTYTNRGLNLPGTALASLRGTRRGFFSFLYNHIYGDTPGRRYIGRMELLRDSLLLAMQSVGQPVSASMLEFVQRAPEKNVSEHGNYRHYYTLDLQQEVARRDREVIDRHGYQFGD